MTHDEATAACKTIAREYGMTLAELRSKRRTREHVRARERCFILLLEAGWPELRVSRFFMLSGRSKAVRYRVDPVFRAKEDKRRMKYYWGKK